MTKVKINHFAHTYEEKEITSTHAAYQLSKRLHSTTAKTRLSPRNFYSVGWM